MMKKNKVNITLLAVIVIFIVILLTLITGGHGIISSIQASVFLGLIIAIPLLSPSKKEPIE